MEMERPHHRVRHNKGRHYNLLLCFRSATSNTSTMKYSTSSRSPGRSNGGEGTQVSLSASLSRRLRSNGSLRRGNGGGRGGCQSSPMFAKKKGGNFETTVTEPSSPKVTCIGQVRVKSKKKKQQQQQQQQLEMSRSKSASASRKRNGDWSFRRTEQEERLRERSQRWVHLPLTICEALKGFGNEFQCLFSCRGRRERRGVRRSSSGSGRSRVRSSSCLWKARSRSSTRGGGGRGGRSSSLGCGAVLVKWLWWEEKKRERDIVEKDEDKLKREKVEVVVVDAMAMKIEKERPKVVKMEEIEYRIRDKEIEKDEEEKQEEDEGRLSICVPPRNALLLMRSRSAPFQASSSRNRFWDSPARKSIAKDAEKFEEEYDNYEEVMMFRGGGEKEATLAKLPLEEFDEANGGQVEDNVEKWDSVSISGSGRVSISNELIAIEEEDETLDLEETMVNEEMDMDKMEDGLVEECKFEEVMEHKDEIFNNDSAESKMESLASKEEEELMEERRASFSSARMSVQLNGEEELHKIELEPARRSSLEGETLAALFKETETKPKMREEVWLEKEEIISRTSTELDESNQNNLAKALPDCLLLMMCEPKLSMEVSKETWVCSNDFVRHRHTERIVAQNKVSDEPKPKKAIQKSSGESSAKRLSTDSKPPPLPMKRRPKPNSQPSIQPPRSSCSKITIGTTGKKLVNAVVYEPLSLTRCKSEPLRSSSKLAPEACFWKNMKLEPHRPNVLGVGAAGIGC